MELYKQSIFFVICDLNTDGTRGHTRESFAFTLPPSSIDIVQPQRVTVTPTPGGYFVDNYGIDGTKITMSGETGNEEPRLTVMGAGKAPEKLTGQEVWFEFDKRISRYSENKQNYTMFFYDLTNKRPANNVLGDEFNKVVQNSDAWEVVLEESILKKSSSKPFFYAYTLNLTGIRRLGTFFAGWSKTEINPLSGIKELIDSITASIQNFNDGMDSAVNELGEYFTPITDIIDSVKALDGQIRRFSDSVVEYEKKLAGLFDEVLSMTSNVLHRGIQIIQFPYDVLETARLEYLSLDTKTRDLIEQIETDYSDPFELYKKYDWDSFVPVTSTMSRSLVEVQDPLFKMVLTAKQNSSYEPIGAVSINGVVVLVYGFTTVEIKENTRLDVLAADLFGDPEFKDVISALNRIYSTDELVVGDTLIVPLLTPDVRYANNAVYNVPEAI